MKKYLLITEADGSEYFIETNKIVKISASKTKFSTYDGTRKYAVLVKSNDYRQDKISITKECYNEIKEFLLSIEE